MIVRAFRERWPQGRSGVRSGVLGGGQDGTTAAIPFSSRYTSAIYAFVSPKLPRLARTVSSASPFYHRVAVACDRARGKVEIVSIVRCFLKI